MLFLLLISKVLLHRIPYSPIHLHIHTALYFLPLMGFFSIEKWNSTQTTHRSSSHVFSICWIFLAASVCLLSLFLCVCALIAQLTVECPCPCRSFCVHSSFFWKVWVFLSFCSYCSFPLLSSVLTCRAPCIWLSFVFKFSHIFCEPQHTQTPDTSD